MRDSPVNVQAVRDGLTDDEALAFSLIGDCWEWAATLVERHSASEFMAIGASRRGMARMAAGKTYPRTMPVLVGIGAAWLHSMRTGRMPDIAVAQVDYHAAHQSLAGWFVERFGGVQAAQDHLNVSHISMNSWLHRRNEGPARIRGLSLVGLVQMRRVASMDRWDQRRPCWETAIQQIKKRSKLAVINEKEARSWMDPSSRRS